MRYVQGVSRDQVMLFPQVLEDYVAEESMVRFIDAYVDSLDLESLGFKYSTPKHTGRLPYNPADMLKLYIYGYYNRVRSSRRLEREAQRNGVPIADFYKEKFEYDPDTDSYRCPCGNVLTYRGTEIRPLPTKTTSTHPVT